MKNTTAIVLLALAEARATAAVGDMLHDDNEDNSNIHG
jgi:hypothetical protein